MLGNIFSMTYPFQESYELLFADYMKQANPVTDNDKLASDRFDKLERDKLVSDKLVSEKLASEKLVTDKLVTDKLAYIDKPAPFSVDAMKIVTNSEDSHSCAIT